MNRSNEEARLRGLNFTDFLYRKVEEMHGPTHSTGKAILQVTVHTSVVSTLLVVSPTNCHAIVNTLLETTDLNLINAVATVYKYSTIAC